MYLLFYNPMVHQNQCYFNSISFFLNIFIPLSFFSTQLSKFSFSGLTMLNIVWKHLRCIKINEISFIINKYKKKWFKCNKKQVFIINYSYENFFPFTGKIYRTWKHDNHESLKKLLFLHWNRFYSKYFYFSHILYLIIIIVGP